MKIYPIINLLILILYYKCLIFFAQILVKVKIHCLLEKRELYFFLDGGSIELVVVSPSPSMVTNPQS